MKLYPAKKYQIEYSNGIPIDCTEFDKIYNIFKNSNSGYIFNDKNILEIDFEELKNIIAHIEDKHLKDILQYLYDNCDKSNYFAHIYI